MKKQITVNGQEYEIDTTPINAFGDSKVFAEVYGVHLSPASGRIANFLREQGREPVNRMLVELDEEEVARVVVSLGHKFSRSKAWRNLFDLHFRKDRRLRRTA